MRNPKIHRFLKWSGRALVGAIFACGGLGVALAQAYPDFNTWSLDLFYRWQPVMTAWWLVGVLLFLVLGYIAALVWTGSSTGVGGGAEPTVRSTTRGNGWPLKRRLASSGMPLAQNPTSHHFDFLLRPEDTVSAQATQKDDGIDLVIFVAVRNRSRSPLWIDVVEKHVMTFGGRQCDSPSGGISRPMRPESHQRSILGSVRIYDGIAGKTGNGKISYLFGATEDDAHWILDVDVDFRVLADPKNKNRQESVPIEIIADRSAYRPRPDEDH